jgi:hypothetical protein
MTIVTTETGEIFGGYTSQAWQSPQKAVELSDEFSFLFSVTKK